MKQFVCAPPYYLRDTLLEVRLKGKRGKVGAQTTLSKRQNNKAWHSLRPNSSPWCRLAKMSGQLETEDGWFSSPQMEFFHPFFLLSTVAFSNPRNHCGVSQRESARWPNVKKTTEDEQNHTSPYFSCGVIKACGGSGGPICLETATLTACF